MVRLFWGWALCLGLAPCSTILAVAGPDLYVAPNGADTNPGTRSKPFATLERARDALRELTAKAGIHSAGATVWLRGGTYAREKPFELTAADSGSAKSTICYRAYPDESVRILGGRVLRHFRPVTDPAVLARLSPPARAAVQQVDLPAEGITDFGQLRSRGFGRPIAPAHLELFFAGQPMTLARWPNEGQWERIAGFPLESAQGDEHGSKIGQLTAGFFYAGDRPRQWQKAEDIWVHGYWAWDWANSYERIESLDTEKRLIKTAAPHGLYGFRSGQRFYFLNVLEELDQPGEWYLDRRTGILYFWPPRPIESGPAVVSLLEGPLIAMNDVSRVTLRGLILEATRGHAITIRGGDSNCVAACAIRLAGNYGVWIEGGHGHRVTGGDLVNTGDGGVSLAGGNRQTLEAGGHSVENCRFEKQGRWSKCYVPAVILSGVGHRVSHNLIQDHPHCAILFSGNEHRIEYNEIHHVALETGDVGAIYTGRDWTFRGNVIRYNFIHHTGGVGMGSMGVYMDDCVSGTTIYGNVFYRTARAVFLGGGRDHRVENNIFVDCQPAVQLDGRGLDKSPVWHNMVYGFMKKQMQAVPPDLYRRRYPAISALDPFYQGDGGVPPEGNRLARNISVGGKWLEVGWHADPQMLSQQDNYVGADPGFVSLEKMDFRLRRKSPVWHTGFQAIPFEKIGLQPDEYRRTTTGRP